METVIRDAQLSDARELLDIYAPYVINTAISFEYDVPSLEEFRTRIRTVKEKYPYLAAVCDGQIVGYCYARQFHERRAFEGCVETSIYVRSGSAGRGIGRLLYTELEMRLATIGTRNMYACIAYPAEENDRYLTKDSIYFHEKMGFTECGHLTRCGYKFGHYYDMVYMEKRL